MTLQGWLQIGLTLLIGFLISIPVGRYLAQVVTDRKTPFDRLFDPIDNFIYLLIGRRICARRWTGRPTRCICWRPTWSWR